MSKLSVSTKMYSGAYLANIFMHQNQVENYVGKKLKLEKTVIMNI